MSRYWTVSERLKRLFFWTVPPKHFKVSFCGEQRKLSAGIKIKKIEREDRKHHPKPNAPAAAPPESCRQVYMGHLLYYSKWGGGGTRKWRYDKGQNLQKRGGLV